MREHYVVMKACSENHMGSFALKHIFIWTLLYYYWYFQYFSAD